MEQKLEQRNKEIGDGNTKKVPRTYTSKTRNWFFTLNNYTKMDIGTILNENTKKNLKQFCFQEEIGENGTRHLQGVLAYSNPISFNTMKKLLPRAHWKRTRNLKKALAYCCKEDTRAGQTWTYNYDIPTTEERMWERYIDINVKELIRTTDLSGIEL